MKNIEFYKKVYVVVAEIPKGKVMTYGQIALWLGYPKRARMVGQAMFYATERENIPCHRVLNSKGELAPEYVFGGKGEQRKMLEGEGVKFKANGCVDLKVSLYEKE